MFHVTKFQILQLSLFNICQLWWSHSYSNPSKHAGEHYISQKVALANDSTLLSTGASRGGTETEKRWLGVLDKSAGTSATSSVENQLVLSKNKELETHKTIWDIPTPTFKFHRLYSAQGEKSEEGGKDKIAFLLYSLHLDNPDLCSKCTLCCGGYSTKWQGGEKKICHQDHAGEEISTMINENFLMFVLSALYYSEFSITGTCFSKFSHSAWW